MHPIVSTGWLAQRLGQDDIVPAHAIYKIPGRPTLAAQEFPNSHIPGAALFDIDEIADTATDLPHMLPDAERFAVAVGALGIANTTTIIAYDPDGLPAAAARCWWMFRAMGHERVAVLNGGLAAWIREALPLAQKKTLRPPVSFRARKDNTRIASINQVAAAHSTGSHQIIDARDAGRFSGTAPEIWPGRRSGHIPGSINLPFLELMDPRPHTLLPTEALAARLSAAGIDRDRPIITSCGSGITACVLALALEANGSAPAAVYDGSWAEWGLPGGERAVET